MNSPNVQKYKRRIETVRANILVLREKRKVLELPAWKFLQKMLENLGSDGMSSEDTDNTDPFQTVYRIRVLEWRRDIDRELTVVDLMRLQGEEVFAPQGSKPAVRRRGEGNPISKRDPVLRLPESFYNPEWLERKDNSWKEKVLCVSKEQFQWLEVLCRQDDR